MRSDQWKQSSLCWSPNWSEFAMPGENKSQDGAWQRYWVHRFTHDRLLMQLGTHVQSTHSHCSAHSTHESKGSPRHRGMYAPATRQSLHCKRRASSLQERFPGRGGCCQIGGMRSWRCMRSHSSARYKCLDVSTLMQKLLWLSESRAPPPTAVNKYLML